MGENYAADHSQLFLEYRENGDISSFERIMDVYNTPLFNYLYHLLRSREEAEDALQEVWIKVIRQKHTYKDQGKFSSWLYRIARNFCLDQFRKKSSRTDDNEIVEDKDGLSYLDLVPADSPTPYENTVEEELLSNVEREVAKMPALIREVYILRAVEGFPFKEIAQIQNAPLGTVLSRMHQAVKRLQPLLQNEENTEAANSA
jgi:RNA polymerase sigma-70 factor (ECF subfamily)